MTVLGSGRVRLSVTRGCLWVRVKIRLTTDHLEKQGMLVSLATQKCLVFWNPVITNDGFQKCGRYAAFSRTISIV